MTSPTEKRILVLEAKLALATKALNGAKFAIDSAIMLQGLTALEPYAHSVGAAIRDLEA